MRRLACLPALVVGCLAGAPALAQESGEGGPDTADQAVAQIASVKDAVAASIEPWLADHAPWLLTSILGSELWRFGALLATILVFAGLRALVVWFSMGTVRRLSQRTETEIDDHLVEAINPPLSWVVMITGVYLGLFWPNFPGAVDDFLDLLYRLILVGIVGWGVYRCVGILTQVLAAVATHTDSDLDDYLVPLVGRILRIVVFALIVVFVLQELGFNVGGLLAGLGVGGLAFALAAQDTVSNWFGALMIYTDRPFKRGDWIKTPEFEGTVEEIGLRSTRVRTFARTLVSVPNSEITAGSVENFSAMPIRRVTFRMGLTYSTTPDQMRATIARFEDILREHDMVDQSLWLVAFDEFDDSSLNILVYYFTVPTAWQDHLRVRQEINLQMMDAMEEVGVEAAFPSRSIYVEQPDVAALRRVSADERQAS